MSGIRGTFVKRFTEANIGCAVDVHMNDDIPHFFLDVVSATKTEVHLSNRGEDFKLKVRKSRKGGGHDFVEIPQAGTFERMFNGGKPRQVRIVPFKGERS